ncbi:RNA-binding protein 48 [Rhinophrynus dorsalis]
MSDDVQLQVVAHQHHEQRRICASRAKYRDGRRPRAVKVYTVNLESRYLLVQGVPAIGVMNELVQQFALYGAIEEYNALHEYPAEEFTEAYLIKFQRLQSARVAKRKLDERSFFGGLLHICYAPEFETVEETRAKLQERRKFVARATFDKDWPVAEKKQVDSAISHQTYQTGHPYSSVYPAHTSNDALHDPLENFNPPTCSKSSLSHDLVHSSVVLHKDTNRDTFQGNVHQIPSSSNMEQTLQTHKKDYQAQRRQNGPGDSIVRFKPRTTQLQERQKKREQSSAHALYGSTTNSQEILIGPKLPEIPKLDMDDISLNISADVIRTKLKEVSSSTMMPTPERVSEETQASAPKKQRRRI